jgi:hypothetical protein
MTLELHHALILDRDIRTTDHEVVAGWSSEALKKYGLTGNALDSRNGQPHQQTRRFLRTGLIARLGDEDLLDEVLIDEMFGQNS